MSDNGVSEAGRSIFVTARDGLRLHVRQYGPAIPSAAVAVVCLPGLARTTADFANVAPALACSKLGRRVIAIDSRGRGQSDYDPNPQNYNLAVELADVVAILGALNISQAVFIGSSRGGILTMLLAATNSSAIAGAVLHDIGPVIEPKGVARIKSYIGKLPQPKSIVDGADILRQLFAAQFPKLTPEQWLAAAQRTWTVKRGALVPTYDVQLASTLADVNFENPLPALWDEFDALARAPVLVIRGANSDILSPSTVNEMRARHPGLEYVEVAGQGHVPLLEGHIIPLIVDFVARCDPAKAPR
jgi:pimeloyl-ACP methyl ester carboxylesterase